MQARKRSVVGVGRSRDPLCACMVAETRMTERTKDALILGGIVAGAVGALVAIDRSRKGSANSGDLTLPPLPYPMNALAPVISERTVDIHHNGHQASYVEGFNANMATLASMRQQPVKDDKARAKAVTPVWKNVAFNAGGAILHKLYWENLRPVASPVMRPAKKTEDILRRDYGSVDGAIREILDVGLGVQGSGWTVLAYSPELGRTVIMPVGNHEDAVTVGARPLLVLDVWEHAYYLDRPNQRKAYLDAIRGIINWSVVEDRLARALEVR